MAELQYVRLDDKAVADGLSRLPGWQRSGDEIAKEFSFESYLDGARFAMKVAEVAEALDHHPNIAIGWRKVAISVNTHAVGGISPYDFELARLIEVHSRNA